MQFSVLTIKKQYKLIHLMIMYVINYRLFLRSWNFLKKLIIKE